MDLEIGEGRIKEFFFNGNNDIIKFMETKIKKIDKNQIDQTIIKEAGDILKGGGLVAFPTETVYGLGADALKEEAALKTYAAKGRPSDNPLIVHIAEYEDLKKIAVNIPAETDILAAHFWPGPLTMIFEKSASVPYGTTGGLDTVAVRMPSDPVAQELIRAGVLPEDYDFEAHKKLVPMQPGDVPVTYADTSALERDFGFKPSTSLRTGLRKFAEWYREFYMDKEER